MNRAKAFLVGDGIVILIGAVFFLWLYLRKNQGSHFKDDIWKERAKAQAQQKSWLAEDQVDHKILQLEDLAPKEKSKAKPVKPAEPQPEVKRAEFRVPKFRGAPHEVLGVGEDASADQANRAFKHWIKLYHPDRVAQLGDKYVDQARRRAEQLNSARHAMLAKIAQRKS